jgi:hypothetical protein
VLCRFYNEVGRVDEENKKTSGGISRREFARRAALTASAVVLPRAVFAQQEKPTNPPASPAPPNAAEQKLSPAAEAEVESKYQALLRAYGDRLSAEQKTEARKALVDTQKGIEQIRAFSLDNSDEPATVFRVFRAPERT